MSESIQTLKAEPLLGTDDLSALIFKLGFLTPAADDAERVDRLDLLERIKSACAGAQALETAEFRESQLTETEPARRAAAAEGRRVPDPESSIGAQVGLARRESPNLGRGKVRLALALIHDLPQTYASLCRGDISEDRAEIVATETSDLSREDRREWTPRSPTTLDDWATTSSVSCSAAWSTASTRPPSCAGASVLTASGR
jgi:hypothetical protein